MSEDGGALSSAAAELRRAFDRQFAEPERTVLADLESLLGLRVGPAEVAVRLGQVRALLPAPRIVPLPGAAPALLGIAGLRGAIVPIYSLGALLEQPPSPEPSRWVILVGTSAPIGLAFDEFAGRWTVPRREISPAESGPSQSHVRETARVGDILRGIVDIPSVVRSLTDRPTDIRTTKEM